MIECQRVNGHQYTFGQLINHRTINQTHKFAYHLLNPYLKSH